MSLVQFDAGEQIFAEGEASDCVLKIVSGRASVVKRVDGREVAIGYLEPGEYAGEMGVIQGVPRGATIRADDRVGAERYSREAFLEMIAGDRDLSLSLLQRLSERLNVMARTLVDGQRPPTVQPAARPRGSSLLLRAESRETATMIPGGERPLLAFPFTVGRDPLPGEAPPTLPVDLTLGEQPPCRLSAAHFRIEETERGYQLRDLDSLLGTVVNGTSLGQDFGADVEPLFPGENEILAGGMDSPFRFTLVIAD